jgi:hypothetical protein
LRQARATTRRSSAARRWTTAQDSEISFSADQAKKIRLDRTAVNLTVEIPVLCAANRVVSGQEIDVNRNFPAVFLSALSCVSGQKLLQGSGNTLHFPPADSAVLDAGNPRNDFTCSVTPIKPKLGLDFLFHTGFTVSVPQGGLDLSGIGNDLSVLFRVVPRDRPESPVYMVQKLRIPNHDGALNSLIEFDGSFVLGEGKYHVDWLMHDQGGHICANFWDIDAKLGPKDAALQAWIPAGLIQPPQNDLFREDPPIARDPPLTNVMVIANFAPRDPGSAALDPDDVEAVVSILRQVARDPRIGIYSVAACSTSASRILYQQDSGNRIDFHAIGQSLDSLKLGLVDAKDLAMKNSRAIFMADVIRKLVSNSGTDALVLIGPRMGPERTAPREIAEALKELDRPVFYLNYNPDPVLNRWRDLIGAAVKQAHGNEYEIANARELFEAWTDIVNRIEKSRRTTKTSHPTGF